MSQQSYSTAVSEIDLLKAYLPGLGVSHSIETYPGTEHGFVFAERYCFSPDGAEKHYGRLADLFGRTLD